MSVDDSIKIVVQSYLEENFDSFAEGWANENLTEKLEDATNKIHQKVSADLAGQVRELHEKVVQQGKEIEALRVKLESYDNRPTRAAAWWNWLKSRLTS